MKLDYETIKGRITGLWKMNTEVTANDLFVLVYRLPKA